MSECTAITTCCSPRRYRTGKAGYVLPGTEVRIADGRRDLHARPARLQGLPRRSRRRPRPRSTPTAGCTPATSARSTTTGSSQITDRKKELIITAGGENIAPQLVEGQLKSIAVVSQAVVIGDRRRYLTALLTLDPEKIARGRVAQSAARRETPAEAATCVQFKAYLEREINVRESAPGARADA